MFSKFIATIAAAAGLLSSHFKSAAREAEYDLRRTEEIVELRREVERLRFQLEAANVGTWDLDIATQELRWSDNMESIFRLQPGSFDGTLQSCIQFVHSDDRETLRQKLGRAIESGEQFVMEYRTDAQGGKVNWVESKGRVLLDPHTGQPQRMMGIRTNITERKKAEQALRDSETRFRTLARHVPVGIFELDRNGTCVFVNEYWQALAGMTPDESVNYGWLRAVHSGDRDRVMHVRSEAIARGEQWAFGYRVQTSDGKLSWAETVVVPIRNNAGEVTGYLGTIFDMTAHKLCEAELERAKKQVSDVLESITEMFIAVDSEWHFTYTNRAAVKKTGKPLEEILGKNIWELFPELVGTEFESQCQRVMTERVPVHFAFLGPRGSWFEAHVHPSSGGLSAYVLDVTERKKNERERLRLAEIVESCEDAIASVGLDGTVLAWNGGAERIYGYSAEEMIGRNISVLDPDGPEGERVRAERRRFVAVLRRGESIRNFQAVRVRKDGGLLWIALSVSPIRNCRGEVVAASAIGRDITELKILEEQLRQAAKLESLGVLAGGIAHDFNNLLVGILGNASLVSDTLPSTSPAKPMLDDVINASERAATLVRQLLAYSGKGKFNIQPVDISELVREMTRLVQASIPKAVTLRLTLAPDLSPVVADTAQIQQLIMNLVINAAEAIGDHPGSVTVTSGEQQIADGETIGTTYGTDQVTPGKYVFFEVEDNGAGMDEATIAKIFDPFFTTKFTGRGLGLSAALGIVRGHNGLIQVASKPGRGSRFKVLFPAAEEKLRQPAVHEATEDLSGFGVILLVDDEELVRRTAAATLIHRGYTVLEAGDGKEAIEVFRRNANRIALVILDLSMPVMGGEECLSRLKSIDPDVPVLLSSGFSEADAARRFQSAGVANYLQKPYTTQRLAKMVKAALSGGGTSRRAA
jgi:PAS domain S-box-containing protein